MSSYLSPVPQGVAGLLCLMAMELVSLPVSVEETRQRFSPDCSLAVSGHQPASEK